VLELVDLRKRYGDVTALDGCTFEVGRGRMLGFLGPNGSGKTTAMRAIFKLVALDGGEVRWDGHTITDEDRRRSGYMPEQRGLYPTMRAVEQITYVARLHGLDRQTATASATRWLERLGLAERLMTPVSELSHGNQQRVQLAAALVHEPDLLVLDEPFSGLDPLAVATMSEVLHGEADRGAAVVFSSHQLDLVEDLCEDIAIIDHGRVVVAGRIAELKAAAPRRRVEVEVDGGDGWYESVDIPGAEIVARENGRIQLSVSRETDPAAVLAMAQRAGHVVHFAYEPPTLPELFVEAVRR